MKILSILASLAIATLPLTAVAQDDNKTLKEFKNVWSADNGNGTYTNPILNADFPDIDIVRVDDTYYMVTTTMFIFPGATILKSHDLVNWEYCANPVKQILSDDGFNLANGKNYYSKGQWASSLKYHNGKFYLHFISFTNSGTKGFLLTATDPEGTWTQKEVDGYYDNGVLFDDGPNGDGKCYIAYGINEIRVSEINPDTWKANRTELVIKGENGLEGCHLYHIGDYYYIYATRNYFANQTIFRSKSPFGPYEEKDNVFNHKRIHQGALVETQTGEWWTMIFKDAGTIGRTPFLEPVTWKDGWPVIGNNGKDVSDGGKAYKKPNVGAEHPRTYLPTNDPFVEKELGKQWGWNHNPVKPAWSLTARPGWLRLKTSYKTKDFTQARNMLTQRVIGYNKEGSSTKTSYGTAKFDVSNMKNGDICGLAIFQDIYGYIGVKMEDGKKYIVQYINNFTIDGYRDAGAKLFEKTGPEVDGDIVYLRVQCNFSNNQARYFYSFDNVTFKVFGNAQELTYDYRSVFVGDKYGLFNYATTTTGGWVDIDWFTTETGTFNEEDYYPESYLYPDGNPNAITTIDADNSANGKTEYYSLSGIKLASPQKGIIIVRQPDGTTSKMFIEE